MRWLREWFVTALAIAVIIAVLLAAGGFLLGLGANLADEKSACLKSGGTWAVLHRSYVCVRPTPTRSP